MAANAKDLAKKVEALRAQADALDKSQWPRGVFVKENQSVADAVREAGLSPGTKYFPFRWMTEDEWRAHEQQQERLTDKENGDGNS